MSNTIVNTFSGGLNWDNHIAVGDNTTYRYATNIINNDHIQTSFISNEHSNRKIAQYGSKIVGIKYVNKLNSSIVLLANGEIHLFNHDEESSKFVASDTEFGCDWGFGSCEWVNIYEYEEYICDLWITYSSNKTYYNINLDELLDPKRKAGLQQSLSAGCGAGCSIRTCEYFKVFKKSCNPHIEGVVLDGGSLRNGTYFIGGRYKNNKGGYSNPFPLTPALHVGGNNNIAGEISNKRIEITIQNTSCAFDQIEFYVHEIINANQSTKALSPQYVSGSSFTFQYTGAENFPNIDKAELLINSRTYIEGEDIHIHNNRALYYRTTPEYEYNFQPIANQIQVEWFAVKVPLADVKKYGLKSFLRGETYAFSLSPNYDNGKHGYGFHIPAISGGGCGSIPTTEEAIASIIADSPGSSGGSGGSSDGFNSFTPQLNEQQQLTLYKEGCNGEDSGIYYINTESFCSATKLYSDEKRTILATTDDYAIQLGSNKFTRKWTGTQFEFGCNVCSTSSGGGGGGGAGNTKPSISGTTSIGGEASVNIKLGILYERLRQPTSSTVNNPHEDKFTPIVREVVDSWNTDMEDIVNAIGPAVAPNEGWLTTDVDDVNLTTPDGPVSGTISLETNIATDELNQFTNVKNAEKNKDIAAKNSADAELIGATWFNAVSKYIDESKTTGTQGFSQSDNTVVGMTPAQILDNPVQALLKFKQASRELIAAVERRERMTVNYQPHEIDGKGSFNYSSDTLVENNRHEQDVSKTTEYGIKYDSDNVPIPYEIKDVEVATSLYKKYPLVARGKLRPKQEKYSKYPCIVDCNGNQIYCGLGGANITHHEMPTNKDIPFWIPKSTGDGSTYQTDTDIMDGYAILLGVEFTNINIPTDVKARLCATNPYNIGMVKRSSANSRMIMKGAATETYTGVNQGKTYLYPKYGANSMEKISKYIDSDGRGTRFGGTSDNTSNITMYCLDQLTRSPYLNGTNLYREGTMRGTGARHMLYSRGAEPGDNRATRKDQSGSVHTLTMHQFSPRNDRRNITGQTYAGANMASSPPTGGAIPLMNKSGQSCAWFTGPGIGRGINDDSFVGDVLQDQAPITNAEIDYYSVYRDLDDQYGDISSLNYTTIIQARGYDLAPSGLVGDTYIGPYSFVKTGYVSDRVGNYFPISNYPGLEGKADRCICDDPNDAVHSLVGQWYWKAIPIDGDAADAKRWAGTHTNPTTKTWQESRMTDTESHYYYPATTKHLITYVGESEANPWLRQKSSLIEEQWFPEINPLYSLHSKDNTGGLWVNAYLNLYYKLIEQPSSVKLALKVLIKSFINLALPMMGIQDWTNPESGIEFAGDMVGAVMQFGIWLLISQVLFTNDFVDKFLGLEACKKDEDGGEEQRIEKWFTNYSNYNNDYSIDYFDPTIVGLPMEYTGCICTDKTMNIIYVSDENDTSHYVNGFQDVRPNSKIMLEESFGKLTKMYTIGGNLYMHTTDGIYMSRSNQIQIPSSVGEILLGNANIISTPQLITNNSDDGEFGLDHPNHGKMTSQGFLFIDYNGKQLVLFDGKSFNILSGKKTGMHTFFKEYLKMCSTTDCKWEQQEDTNYFAFGLDPRYGRILFTKGDTNNSYTMSYCIATGKWVSFHDYVPQEYLNDRNDLYSIYSNGIWKHDDTTKFNTYYDKYYGFKIDINTVGDQDHTSWLSADIFTEAKINNLRDRDITFNQLALLNSWQTTGYVNLQVDKTTGAYANVALDKIIDKTNNIDIRRMPNSFRVNELHDYTVNHNAPVLINNPCSPEPILENYGDYSDRSYQYSKDRIVSDNYYYYRFIFNKFASAKIYFKKLATEVNRKIT